MEEPVKLAPYSVLLFLQLSTDPVELEQQEGYSNRICIYLHSSASAF